MASSSQTHWKNTEQNSELKPLLDTTKKKQSLQSLASVKSATEQGITIAIQGMVTTATLATEQETEKDTAPQRTSLFWLIKNS